MVGFPHAKINLGLYITSKRSDGYHDLVSCFYPVAWEEALEIIPSSSFSFSSSGLNIPGDSGSNLVVKAYELLKKNHTIPTSSIHLHKAIPMGAGLGGGSADAAVALLLLNQLYELSLSKEELIGLSAQLGSDCAFFIHATPCIATSRGEVLSPIACSLKGYRILLVHPGIHISTQQAYAGVTPRPAPIHLEEVLQDKPASWKNKLHNQFEEHLFVQFPEVAQIKEKLYKMGADYASMSGSGSAVYGIFKEDHSLEEMEWPEHYKVKVVSGV
ncbi:MAG: 4-(cytidine 5-diphospho)-2-C-methyl-D-erythritol kinase [Cytophagaceae bacterium]|jgi:4-diphosphocytidyl-2-C-methyl-D-erythritol kinase|nr:4-(cytidine 5-diphospho)-2-C-methyl-D-erythritol kinase [Cytophagaceae bacterium]